MGLFRLLFWLAIITAAFWLWRRFTRSKSARPRTDDATAKPVPMVRCEHCGTHVPRDHALAKGEQWFCSQAHLEQGRKSSGH